MPNSFADSRMRWALAGWTLVIWVSRLRNIVADDELDGAERAVSALIAAGFVIAALALTLSLLRSWAAHRAVLLTLVVGGVLRWTIRAPIILFSNDWTAAFKVVHTILWAVTVGLSIAAWRELSRTIEQR